MIKDATINGTPLSHWGVSLLSGAEETLLTPAPMKDYITNESRLEHGVRLLNVTPKTDRREVSIPFLIEGNGRADFLQKYSSFVDELYTGTIVLSIPELGKSFTLTYRSSGKYGSYGLCRAKLIVRFIEAVPVENKNEV